MKALAASAFGLFAALAASPASACDGPDFHTYALRSAPPAVVNPGEVVLELDTDSMLEVTKPPAVIEVQGHKLEFSRTYGVFTVERVHAGNYEAKQATIRLGYGNGCWFLYGGPDARFLVGSPTTDDGFAYLATRPISGAELRVQILQDRKAAN